MDTLVIAIITIVAGLLGAIGGAWIQGRFQFKHVREIEKRVDERLTQLKDAYEKLDLMNWIRMLSLTKQYQGVVDMASTVLQSDPQNADARFFRGRAYAQLRKTSQAVEDLRVAEKLEPKRPEIQLALAQSEFAAGNWPQAEAAARAAIAQNVHDRCSALSLLGDAFSHQHKYDEAISSYEQCLDAYPEHTPAIDGAGTAKLALAAKGTISYDDVVQWYTKYVEGATPNASTTYVGRAMALILRNQSGDREKASKDLQMAATKNPAGTQPYEIGGRMLLNLAYEEPNDTTRLELAKRSLEIFNQALTRSTRAYQPAIRNWIAYTNQLMGNYDESVQQAKMSRDQSPEFPNNHQALVCALLAAYRWQEARDACNEWLVSPRSSESLPTRIRMGGFLCLADIANKEPQDAVTKDIASFLADMNALPEFKVAWDWNPAKKRTLEFIASQGINESLAKDIVALLCDELSPAEFRRQLAERARHA